MKGDENDHLSCKQSIYIYICSEKNDPSCLFDGSSLLDTNILRYNAMIFIASGGGVIFCQVSNENLSPLVVLRGLY